MKIWARRLGGVLFLVGAYVGAFFLANDSAGADRAAVNRNAAPGLPVAGEALTILTWNLGYGGLGAESDFKVDGGKNVFPPSRAIVRKNVEGIVTFLQSQPADIVLLQELAHGGPINYWVDLKARVDAALPGRDRLWYAEINMRLLPWPLNARHGQGIYSRRAVADHDLVPLPVEDTALLGLRRRYVSAVARLPIETRREDGWTICSVHLAAFDANATVRTQQLRELMAWAQEEYARGQHVVIGGDWNLRLFETEFPNTTDPKYLFWVFPFPEDALPPGWRIAADATTPSVRTNERAYRRGENYTTVIDGFIVSPNVEIEFVRGIDLDFAFSDHNPVELRVRALATPRLSAP